MDISKEVIKLNSLWEYYQFKYQSKQKENRDLLLGLKHSHEVRKMSEAQFKNYEEHIVDLTKENLELRTRNNKWKGWIKLGIPISLGTGIVTGLLLAN